MNQEHRNLKQRKMLILSYVGKYPLSTIREISDNYASKKGNFRIIKNTIYELLEEGKIESLIHNKRVYILKPSRNREKNTLISIMQSEKIFYPSFTKLPFDDDFHFAKPLFPQVVEQCIQLFHLRFKIFLIETRRLIKSEITSKQLTSLKRKFVVDFVKLLKTYSYKKIIAQGSYIAKREKNDPSVKNPDQKTILVWLSNYILTKFEQDKLYFDMIRFNKIPLARKTELLEIATDDSPKEASLVSRTTLKNIHRLLKPLMYDRGKGKGFSIEKAEIYRQAQEGRPLTMNVRNEDLSRILFKIIAKRIVMRYNTRKERRHAVNRLRKKFGVDTSKILGLFDI